MNRNRWIQVASLLVMLACLTGTAGLVPVLNEQRVELQLSPEMQIGEAMPPHIAVATAALGPFRGLLIDLLWHRATKLQDEGKYYEANTLSQWITTLQPRFPAVWVFQAWNMAYNISVATHTKEERWDWINKGIRLLRDKGIVANPHNVYLYREIAWTFWHKIAAMSDDAHWYYKTQLAVEWQQIMGTPNIGATSKQTIDAFRPIANAPKTIEQLCAQKPDVKALVDELAQIGFAPDANLLIYLGKLAMFNYVSQPIFTDWPLLVAPENLDKRLAAMLQDPKRVESVEALLAFMRHKVLVEEYHMEPDRMLLTMETYGPLDWRHPCAHSLYWAMAGVQLSDMMRYRDFRETTQHGNTHRLNVMSIQRLARTGQLTFDPLTKYIGNQPDPRFIPYYDLARERAIEPMRDDPKMKTVVESYDGGHENFLLQMAYFSFIWGDEKQAREIFLRSADLYRNTPESRKAHTYEQPLEEFVLAYLKQNKDDVNNVRQYIEAALRRGIREGLAEGDLERWDMMRRQARKIHTEFQKSGVTTTIDSGAPNRNMLPKFDGMVAEVYVNHMQAPGIGPLMKSRVWLNTPLDLRQATYKRIENPLTRQCRAMSLNFAAMFPAPKGLKMPTAPPQDAAPTEQPIGQTERR